MTQDNWKTLRVPTEQYEKAKAQKESNGRTWGQQIVRAYDDEGPDLDEETAQEIINCIGAEVGGPSVDSDKLARQVAATIDYAELASKVANELEGRMR